MWNYCNGGGEGPLKAEPSEIWRRLCSTPLQPSLNGILLTGCPCEGGDEIKTKCDVLTQMPGGTNSHVTMNTCRGAFLNLMLGR